jgi:hypothetical protein
LKRGEEEFRLPIGNGRIKEGDKEKKKGNTENFIR